MIVAIPLTQKMKIEVIKQGKKIGQVEVDLSDENSYKAYLIRKAIIENKIIRLRRIYPCADFLLVFESKMK